MTASSAIILMAKQPRPGKTKTRMCPPYSPASAARLYEALLRDSLDLVGRLEGVQAAVAISPPESIDYFRQVSPPGALLIPVEGQTIGVCLARATEALFERGFRKALAMNTDGPSLPVEYLLQALDLLDAYDVVLGPGEDGGYYLIGLSRAQPGMFAEIPWSTSAVLECSLAQAGKLGLRAVLTPAWYDVDTPEDAQRLRAELDRLPADRLVHTRRFFQEDSPGSVPG